jgi:hypothetical protein
MVDKVSIKPGRIIGIKNDHITFDSALKSVNLYPEEYAIRRTTAGGNPLTVEFPDVLKVNAHWRASVSGGLSQCVSYSMMIYQEWGPDFTDADDWWFPNNPSNPGAGLASNYRNLPMTYIGTVPALTDYLDVRVKLYNTVVPSTILGVPILSFLKPDRWTNLPGGSCPIEIRAPLSRLFDFKRFGNDIYMRRFQSVYRGSEQAPWLVNNDDSASSGWTYGDTPFRPDNWLPTSTGQPRAVLGRLVYQLDQKGPDGSGAKRRRVAGSNACSVVDTSNYRSVYQGDLIIRPGRRT